MNINNFSKLLLIIFVCIKYSIKLHGHLHLNYSCLTFILHFISAIIWSLSKLGMYFVFPHINIAYITNNNRNWTVSDILMYKNDYISSMTVKVQVTYKDLKSPYNHPPPPLPQKTAFFSVSLKIWIYRKLSFILTRPMTSCLPRSIL